MDPSEMPTVLNCETILESIGGDNFEDTLCGFLSENEANLPLQDLCLDGYVSAEDWVDFSNVDLDTNNGSRVTGTVDVSFTESSPTGCRDMPFNQNVSAKLNFRIDVEAAEIEVWADYSTREYDPEEF